MLISPPIFFFMLNSLSSIERIEPLNDSLERDTLALRVAALGIIVGGITALSLV